MCQDVQKNHEETNRERLPLGIIDLAIWYSASTFSTIKIRQEGDR